MIGFGLGLSPVAPGTCGSLLGLPLVWLLQWLPGAPGLVQVCVAAALLLGATEACRRAARQFGGPDPRQIVLDEIVGVPVVFVFVPMGVVTGVLGFVLYRLFDVAKPWPVREAGRLRGGLGIVADDAVAGLYAAGTLMLSVRLLEEVSLL